ncbi:hypothetical protein Q1695_006535 [Nippostrongylus brasiliensis]|nr:hypothetical protein Q1695_006535 [Nippostrongylus brasiliensis]
MRVSNTDFDDLNESFEDLMLDGNDEAGVGDGDMAPAINSDTDGSDSDMSGDGSDGTEENTWLEDFQKNDRGSFDEPVGASTMVDSCETPLEFYELFFTEELLSMVTDQTNIYGQEKQSD